MNKNLIEITAKYGNDKARLMDILTDVQDALGYISGEAIEVIADQLKISGADVIQTASFYHFFSFTPRGKYAIYLNNSVPSMMAGCKEIADAFVKETGCKFGETTADGLIGLNYTACIGMSDQEPAAIINHKVFTRLTPAKVTEIVKGIKAGKNVEDLVTEAGDGNNANQLVKAMVRNNIKQKGPVLFSEYTVGSALKRIIDLSPEQVISQIKESDLRGRGGAGFPTGLKWDFCSRAEGSIRYVVCNADEGEPGTFKDRVILTELPGMLFEGMMLGGYAIGAKEGILYLRSEYVYLKKYLEKTLDDMRKQNLLGKNVAGKKGFDFDIRIQIGAGAYVCGEESALIESAEGKRGEPRSRPPYPITNGYFNQPSIVNNVETLCSATRIIEKGAAWFKGIGTKHSSGTKLISISGDCKNPGIYEITWGISVKEVLDLCGAEDVQAVQVAGPAGACISPDKFSRKFDYDDLMTGGSMIVLGKYRDILKDVALNFMEFFADESCGSCVPCRTLTSVLKSKLENIIAGKGVKKDIDEMLRLGKMMKDLNRCGLGQTAANPVISTIENFREKYEARVKAEKADGVFDFDMAAAVKDSCDYVGRKPNIN